jgi:hypothetical protein
MALGDARAFKTAWFAKAARKAAISDAELCRAFDEAKKGLADDLGGGVYKKRLNKNMHRSILLAKGLKNWVFVYVFAKQDRANIEKDELEGFRKLAKSYEGIEPEKLQTLLATNALMEICND